MNNYDPCEYTSKDELYDMTSMGIDYNLSYCGKEMCPPLHSWGPDIRKKFVLHVILNGKGIYTCNNMTYHLQQNDVFMIYPGTEVFYESDEVEPWSYAWIGFDGVSAMSLSLKTGFSPQEPVVHLEKTDEVIDYINKIIDISTERESYDIRKIGLLFMLFSQLIENNKKISPSQKERIANKDDYYVKKAINYINENYFTDCKISHIAKEISVNRSYLSTLFKKTMNKSPSQYLIDIRVVRAKELLKNSQLPIKEIGTKVGYTDQLVFSKMFKQHTGFSPQQYRKDIANQISV